MSRIVFFVSSMQGGGAERVASLLCNYWVEQGHQVLLVPTFSGRGECLYPLDKRVGVTFLADRIGTTNKTLCSTVRRLFNMRMLLREFRADLVVSFLPQINVAALMATLGLGVPVIVSERVYPPSVPLAPIWAILRRWLYPRASRVVMQTRRGLEWLQQESPASQGCVIPNPCIFPLPESHPHLEPDSILPGNRRILLGVGRLEIQKDFSTLINAFANVSVCFPEWDLVILGDGHERQSLEKQVAANGLSGRVHLPGRAGNMDGWYRRASLYVMSSSFEGFPNTLMEAMAYGVPSVSFDCDTGPADLIVDGVNGCLIPPGAGVKGLVDKLTELMADEDKRDALGLQATEVRECYSMDRIARLWDQLLGPGKRDD